MLYLIDNYDSFTYNLLHYLMEIGADVTVLRNDAKTAQQIIAEKPSGVVISPGPGRPEDAGISMDLIRLSGGNLPVLGVCLGHQCIGEVFGGKVVRGPVPMHGKVSAVTHRGQGIFKGVPSPFQATRYHSLVIDKASLPQVLINTAETEDGMIMGVQHTDWPVFGVQFHPESIASEHGHVMLRNFLEYCRK